MNNLTMVAIIALVVVVGLAVVLLGLSRLYHRASKELSFVRTGFGGAKIVKDGGALVLPVFHETIPVNMTTLKLPVSRQGKDALITNDRLRVNVSAEFFVRVQPNENSIADAAQTLGRKTLEPQLLRELIEGKFVDALRSVAASMTMDDLHEKRSEFVQQVQKVVSQDILKNGLELESVSLTGLDQTPRHDLDENNAFDAEGLTRLAGIVEDRRKRRNDIEQDTAVQIRKKNLEATQASLTIQREEQFAKLETDREIAERTSAQEANMAKTKALGHQEAEEARMSTTRVIEEKRLANAQAIETREIEKRRDVELAEQNRQIAVSNQSR